MAPATIKLCLLKEAISLLLDRSMLSCVDGELTIDPAKVYYLDVAPESLNDIGSKTPILTVGSLLDDNEFLANMMASEDEKSEPIVYMLIHAAPLLRYIAEDFASGKQFRP